MLTGKLIREKLTQLDGNPTKVIFRAKGLTAFDHTKGPLQLEPIGQVEPYSVLCFNSSKGRVSVVLDSTMKDNELVVEAHYS